MQARVAFEKCLQYQGCARAVINGGPLPGVTTITENPIIHKIPLFMSLVKCQLQAVQSLS